MTRLLIAAALMLGSLPSFAGVPSYCRPVGEVMAIAADNPNAPQRLTGDVYAAVLEAFNAIPPATNYDGPLWVKRMGRSVLVGGLNPDVPGHVCFAIMAEGPSADALIAALTTI